MTKEELIKEAEDKGVEYTDSLKCAILKFSEEEGYAWSQVEQAYEKGALDFAEPREKRIKELEQKLEQTEKDLADYQFNYPTIKELEKENELFRKQVSVLAGDTPWKELKDVSELIKENTELKEGYYFTRCVHSGCPYLHLENRNCLKVGGFCTSVSNKDCPMMKNLKDNIKLTKATDLLKKMHYLYFDPCVTEQDLKNRDKLFEEVKQFLNREVEK